MIAEGGDLLALRWIVVVVKWRGGVRDGENVKEVRGTR